MKQKAIRITVALLVFWALVPVFTGGCPCAHAGEMPLPGLSLQAVPCHGCCPEIQTGCPSQAYEPAEPTGLLTSRQQARLPILTFKAIPVTGFLMQGPEEQAPPGAMAFGPSAASTPLYLTLQVFRI